MIVIIDYGVGNLRSILHKIEKLGIKTMISSDSNDLKNAEKLILPGVGNFSRGMENLRTYKLINSLNEAVLSNSIPILGICLGMQLFGKYSEEGNARGLGWIDAETKKFDFHDREEKIRIPHVGWNTIEILKNSALVEGIGPESRFYFTHSYHMSSNNEEDVIARSDYGIKFSSIVQKGNIYGTQFHPEKSHFSGMKIIENFIKKC